MSTQVLLCYVFSLLFTARPCGFPVGLCVNEDWTPPLPVSLLRLHTVSFRRFRNALIRLWWRQESRQTHTFIRSLRVHTPAIFAQGVLFTNVFTFIYICKKWRKKHNSLRGILLKNCRNSKCIGLPCQLNKWLHLRACKYFIHSAPTSIHILFISPL